MDSVSELTELIDVYAGAVGLRRSLPQGVDGGEGDQGMRWEAPYAQLMLWRIQSTGKAQFRAEVEKAQEIMDSLLVSAEYRISGVVDGYLLLFLGNEPDEDLHSLIRGLELDTNVCRKSFIWPGEGDTPEARWQRLWRTTVIGLPLYHCVSSLRGCSSSLSRAPMKSGFSRWFSIRPILRIYALLQISLGLVMPDSLGEVISPG